MIAFISYLLIHLCFILFDSLQYYFHNWVPSVVNETLHAIPTSSLKQNDDDNPCFPTFVSRETLDCPVDHRASFSVKDSLTSKGEDSVCDSPSKAPSSVSSSKLSPSSCLRNQESNREFVSKHGYNRVFDSNSSSGINNKPPLIASSISNNSTTSSSSNNSSLFCHPLLLQAQQSFLSSSHVSQSSHSSSHFLSNHHHQLQQQPPSINFYESYFDDSYVGDFTGEVDPDRLQDERVQDLTEVQRGWCSDPDLVNPSLLEFTYDSFGPESIVFNNQISNNGELDHHHSNEGQQHQPNLGKKEESEESRPTEQEEDIVRATTVNQRQLITHLNSSTHTSVDDSESLLMSLSITEPQLSQKLNNCFDSNKIANGYGITSFVREEDEEQLQDYDNHSKQHINQQLNHIPNNINTKVASTTGKSSKSELKSVTDCDADAHYLDDEGRLEKKSFTSQEVQSRTEKGDLPHMTHSSNSHSSTAAYNTSDSLDKLGDEKLRHHSEEMLLQNDINERLDNSSHDAKHKKESHNQLNHHQDLSSTTLIPTDACDANDKNMVSSSHLEGDESMILSCIPSSASSSSVSSSSVVSTTSQPSCSSPPLSYSSSTASSERDSSSAFASRNSTLTRSQRKKISPRLNFSQILSVSDDTAKVLMQNHGDDVNDTNQEIETKNGHEPLSNLNAREVILSPADIIHHNNHHGHILLNPHHLHSILLDSETASSSDNSDFFSRVSTPNTEG
jgi:hypothetical protein